MTEFELVKRLMAADRSVRRFDFSRKIAEAELREVVGLVRYCASGRNLQPLRYRIVTDPDSVTAICAQMKWAGYLTDWEGPAHTELPAALILQYLDTDLTENPLCDEGLQIQAITLGATAKGYGCCIVKSFNAGEIGRLVATSANLRLAYIIAVGYPAEEVRIEPWQGDVKYWRDAEGIHHVPKRPADDLFTQVSD